MMTMHLPKGKRNRLSCQLIAAIEAYLLTGEILLSAYNTSAAHRYNAGDYHEIQKEVQK